MVLGFHLVLAALLAQAPFPVPSASPSIAPVATPASTPRQITVLNEGNNPIFTLRIGGGPDLLSFDRVIDVSEAQEVDLSLDPSTCKYDVEATYRDGHVETQHGVDLCRVDRITFRY